MTNEELASICPHCLTDTTRSCHNNCTYYERYKAMEEKDQQFKEYLEEKAKNNVPPGRTKDDLNLYSPSYFEGRDDVIREIINELFG
ncbi:MAG: hypothetical protein MJY49_03060 [Bacteroidales bacterium]|nr:hypothetical protein [Bacteroidales bacterium]